MSLTWKEVYLGNKEYFELLPSGIDDFKDEKEYLSTESVQGTKINKIECRITYKDRPSRANMQPLLNSVWFAKMQSTMKVYAFTKDNEKDIKKYILSTGFLGVKIMDNKISPAYIKFYLTTSKFNSEKDNLCTGSTQRGINNSFAMKIKIPLPFREGKPDLEEQARVLKILGGTEKLKEKSKKSQELLDEYLKSVFDNMFGDPVINNKSWDKKPLSQFGDVKTGNTPSRLREEYYGNYIDWIKSDNLNTPYMHITPSQEKLSEEGARKGRVVPKGSVLVTCIAGSVSCIGNCAITDKEVAFNQQINAIVPNKNTNAIFIYFLINNSKKHIQSFSQKSLKGIVNKKSFENIAFICPPLPLQQKFSKIVEQVEKMKENIKKTKHNSEELFNSLMQKAFRGEL